MAATADRSSGWSLRLRVLSAGVAVVLLFTVLTGLAVDRAFRESVDELSRERLLARIYMLMGAAEVTPTGELNMPAELPEPRLAVPGSGSYAAVVDKQGELVWRSDSSLGLDVPYPAVSQPGNVQLQESMPSESGVLQTFSYPVFWELEDGSEQVLVFKAAESRAGLDAEVAAFRSTLRAWLGGGALVLLFLQVAVLIWSLAPVRRVAEEIRDIETGTRDALQGDYPRELRALTDNLNALIRGRETRLKRYRNTLADLAHSLKTPLAVLRAQEDADGAPRAGREQLDRIEESIEFHLQRAAFSGRSPLAAPVAVRPATQRVVASLNKIYHDKALRIECEVPEDLYFSGDPGDLAEILGNLGDNACKWASSRVRFGAVACTGDGDQLRLRVEDDGPGVPESLRQSVLERGVRADSRRPGQGIGLAVVRETIEEIYGGSVQIGESELGGTCVELRLP